MKLIRLILLTELSWASLVPKNYHRDHTSEHGLPWRTFCELFNDKKKKEINQPKVGYIFGPEISHINI
jgi:hypothetical protein